jgi:transcriptional regulator with PAS, ATPase and Fis domain
LYYRINVVPLRVPPLRERREDILPLCLFFLDHFNRKFNKSAGPLQADTIATLENAHWAGNVRELKHTIERAWVVNADGPIAQADLGFSSASGEVVNKAVAVQTPVVALPRGAPACLSATIFLT